MKNFETKKRRLVRIWQKIRNGTSWDFAPFLINWYCVYSNAAYNSGNTVPSFERQLSLKVLYLYVGLLHRLAWKRGQNLQNRQKIWFQKKICASLVKFLMQMYNVSWNLGQKVDILQHKMARTFVKIYIVPKTITHGHLMLL